MPSGNASSIELNQHNPSSSQGHQPLNRLNQGSVSNIAHSHLIHESSDFMTNKRPRLYMEIKPSIQQPLLIDTQEVAEVKKVGNA